MQAQRHLPDMNHLSVLAATILLAYSLARFVDIPEQVLSLPLPGIFLVLRLNFQTVVSILVAALAASGMEWLLHDTTRRKMIGQPTYQHWMLPALTALVIGVPLASLASGWGWWIVFTMGGALLMLVFLAEYIVADPVDIRHPHATAVLTALSFALFLILTIAARAAELRTYLLLPALVPSIGLVSLRTLYLRSGGRWMLAWGAGIALVIGQLAAGLHYWPIGPISFGLALLGPAYALTSFAGAYEEGQPMGTRLVEPLAMLAVIWGLAALLA
jgi:hypothetical protein